MTQSKMLMTGFRIGSESGFTAPWHCRACGDQIGVQSNGRGN
jgi:hypothetical protein